LVDDDSSVLKSMAAALEFDFDVTSCNSAARALELLRNGDFHVVCSDYSMPGMTGIELLQQASALPQPMGCLLVTGSSVFIGSKSDADYYVLVKPVDPERLGALILQLARTAEVKRGAKR
jgi:DNA-binding NtrC family response regulator